MRITRFILYSIPAILIASCGRSGDTSHLSPSSRLMQQLEQKFDQGIMLGHQDDLAYGCMWYDTPGGSDMNDVSGEYPAVFGWDIGNIEVDGKLNPDSVKIDKIREYITMADSLGAISTVRWSAAPIAETDSAHISSVLPGGANNARYIGYLDRVAAFLSSLKDADGNEIAVIFQPLYCPNEDCHWWCKNDDDIETYKQVWIYTVSYLRDDAGVNNALFAFSLATPHSAEDWARYYPGDKYVDILGIDIIAEPTESIDDFSHDFATSIDTLTEFAGDHNKLPAVTATGMVGVKTPGFFTQHMAEVLCHHPLSYVMLWKNSWKEEDIYFVPLKGHPMADDFNKFLASDYILTCSDLTHTRHTVNHL